MERNQQPVAIVTGGSRGIGREVVLRLAEDGYNVAFCARSASPEAKRTADAARNAGAHCLFQVCDVTDLQAVTGFVEQVERELGHVRALVNSAGVVRDRSVVMMPLQEWTEVIATNLTGTFNFCRTVGFGMVKRRAGAIINMSSVAGVYGHAKQANYAASKGGVNSLSRTLAKEFARYGVRVNAVAPGYIETDMTDGLPEKDRREALAAVPLGRFGTPQEVADFTAYLLSDRAAYITGQVLQIDGGVAL